MRVRMLDGQDQIVEVELQRFPTDHDRKWISIIQVAGEEFLEMTDANAYHLGDLRRMNPTLTDYALRACELYQSHSKKVQELSQEMTQS